MFFFTYVEQALLRAPQARLGEVATHEFAVAEACIPLVGAHVLRLQTYSDTGERRGCVGRQRERPGGETWGEKHGGGTEEEEEGVRGE